MSTAARSCSISTGWSSAVRAVVALATAATITGAPLVSAQPAHAASPGDRVALEPMSAAAQVIEPRVVLRPLLDAASRLSAKGNDLWEISALGSFDVPEAAMRAYKTAAATMARTDAACQIPWTLLAAIGRVESDHGRYGGSVLGSDGVPRPAIRGIALDGVGPVAAIRDSDDGRFDGDTVWDRAVGPMQFIPTTWASAGRDGDGDGVTTPNDIDDAALAAADYLCPDSGSILPVAAMEAAILRYNHSGYYVSLVRAFEAGYRTGSFSIPSPPPPPGGGVGLPDESATGEPEAPTPAGPAAPQVPDRDEGGDKPRDKPGDKPGGGRPPVPTPTPTPTPTAPPAPTVEQRTGQLTDCGGWCLDGVRLDLGSAAKLGSRAAADHDGDTVVETNAEELAGLLGATVSVEVRTGDPLLLLRLNGHAY